MFGTLSLVNKGNYFYLNVFLFLYKNEQIAQICISPMESVSTGFNRFGWWCCHVYTQESSGGGLLSMRPTAGLPALMKCFLSLIAWRVSLSTTGPFPSPTLSFGSKLE